MEEPSSSAKQESVGESGGVNIEAKGSTLTVQGHIVGGNLTIQAAERKVLPPRQIPPPPADFTGREQEIAAVMLGARAGGGLISGMHGMGGIGKSTLALEVARRLGEQYPDGHLFVALAGTSGQPLSPSAAMAQVIRAWEPEARLPEESGSLAGLYRTVLHGRRVLLLLDDAVGAAQVEPLLPPPGCICALLVTTRIEFHLPGLHTLHLEALPRQEAVALLRQLAPRLTEEAETLAALCGDLPLALRVAGSQLATRRALTPAAYLRRLSDARQRLAWVEATLTLSYDMLDATQQQRWRALAVFPATFDAPAVAAVWGDADADESADTLDALVSLSLVEWDEPTEGEEAGRYHLHDLARLFATARLPDEERNPATLRHAEYYCRVLAQARKVYRQGNMLTALRLFDREQANIETGQGWAAENTVTDNAAARLCSAYPNAGFLILSLRYAPHSLMRWSETGLEAAQHLGDRVSEAAHLGNLGLVYADLGKVERAIQFYEQQLGIVREIGDRPGEGRALGNLGVAYARLGEIHRASDFYEQNLVIVRELGDRWGEGMALGHMGIVYAVLGEVECAIDFYKQQLDIVREIGDKRGEGNALGNLGLAYVALGDVQDAIDLYEQRLAIAREIGDRSGEAITLFNFAGALDKQGNRSEAVGYAQAALALFEQLHSPHAAAVRATLAEWGTADDVIE